MSFSSLLLRNEICKAYHIENNNISQFWIDCLWSLGYPMDWNLEFKTLGDKICTWDGKHVIYLTYTKSYEVGHKQSKIGLSSSKKRPALGRKLCSVGFAVWFPLSKNMIGAPKPPPPLKKGPIFHMSSWLFLTHPLGNEIYRVFCNYFHSSYPDSF